MKRDFYDRFNVEVERYRKMLLHYARSQEWDVFERKAGSLFDYLERVELTVLERKFFTVFMFILAVLLATVVVIVAVDGNVYPAFEKSRNGVIISALALSCYELYFFLDFRNYVKAKSSRKTKRKERFIREIEQDFREMTASGEEEGTLR
jgi:hypothetical protein